MITIQLFKYGKPNKPIVELHAKLKSQETRQKYIVKSTQAPFS